MIFSPAATAEQTVNPFKTVIAACRAVFSRLETHGSLVVLFQPGVQEVKKTRRRLNVTSEPARAKDSHGNV
jgi:hypothetical protein